MKLLAATTRSAALLLALCLTATLSHATVNGPPRRAHTLTPSSAAASALLATSEQRSLHRSLLADHNSQTTQATPSTTSQNSTAATATPPRSSSSSQDGASASKKNDHKPVLPLTARDVIMFALAFLILMLAAGAGIGGGVLLVPLLSLLGGFHFIEVVALSNVAIFAGAIANLIFNVGRHSPVRPPVEQSADSAGCADSVKPGQARVKPGPLIDYDLLLLFGPPIIVGSVGGAKLNYFVPSWITKLLVLLVLAPTAWRMFVKAKLLWMAESRLKRQARADIIKAAAAAEVQLEAEQGGDAKAAEPDADCHLPHDKPLAPLKWSRSLPYSQQLGGHPTPSSRALPLSRALSDSTHARTPLAASQHLAPLSELAPADTTDTDLVSLLGPELMLLQSPAAAAATLQVQRSSRQLSLQASSSLRGRGSRQLSLQASSKAGSSRMRDSFARLHLPSFGASSGVVPRAPSGLAAAAAAAAAASNGSDASCTVPDAVEGGCCDETAVEEELAALGVVSPFQLHQRELMVRQESLLRQHSMRAPSAQRAASMLQRRHSSVVSGPAAAAAARKDSQQPAGADAAAAADTEAAAGGGALLPVAAKSRSCLRLEHEGCCHSPQLEQRMRAKLAQHQSAQYPKSHIAGLLSMLLVVLAAALCAHTLLDCGTWQFWLVVLSPLPVMALIWAAARWHVLWRLGWQDALGVTSLAEIHWTPRTTLLYPVMCISVGVLAGLLGLGGGTVMTPMLLELGVHPATSAASSQALMLISSSCSSIVYLVGDAVPQDWGLAMTVIGFCSTLLGQTVVSWAVKRTGRSSLLVLILAFLFALALGAGLAVVAVAIATLCANPSSVAATRREDMCGVRR